MTQRLPISERMAFALVGEVFCILLALRPVPGEFAPNDTGRYVVYFRQYCDGLMAPELVTRETSFELFHLIASPACLSRSDFPFLFGVATLLPLALLLFVAWRNGTFFWAGAMLFSFYGLELTTNALRQGFASAVFFGALFALKRYPIVALVLGATSILAHASIAVFYPFLLWLYFLSVGRRLSFWTAGVLGMTVVIISLAYGPAITSYVSNFEETFALYTEFYSEEISPAFLFYVTFPLYFVFGLRFVYERKSITVAEYSGLIYSTVVLGVCFLFFPFITYRVAFVAVPLQIFLVLLSDRYSRGVAGLAMTGFVAHWFFFYANSTYYSFLVSG